MNIWYYAEQRPLSTEAEALDREDCIFCKTKLGRNQEDERKVQLYEEMNYGMSDRFATRCSAFLGICPACGWWKYGVRTLVGGKSPAHLESKVGSLKKLDLSDISIPLSDVRAYLTARYEAIFATLPCIVDLIHLSLHFRRIKSESGRLAPTQSHWSGRDLGC